MAEKTNTCTTSYYNGACPVCRTEMHRYKRHAEEAGAPLAWVDISKDENKDALKRFGITQDMAFRRIYVVDAGGVPLAGVEGLAAIWQAIPRWAAVGRLTQLPVLKPILAWLYEHVLARLVYEWNRVRLKKTTQQR